jgi:hypothetical protein
MFLFNVLQSQQDGKLKCAHEVENLPVTDLSMLEVNFGTARHVYGALVLQLLRISQIRVATKKLSVVLPWWFKVILRQPYGSYIETHYMSTIYICSFDIRSQPRNKYIQITHCHAPHLV